jgi:type II restriction enzyme
MYKPIQIAELLREFKRNPSLDPMNLESYRNLSKELRNRVTIQLFGKVSTSSMRFQDDLWNESAVPPSALASLSQANLNGSIVEQYIYQHVYSKNAQLIKIRKILNDIDSLEKVENLFDSFDSPGLRTSADRLYEVFVLSVLQTNLEASKFEIAILGKSSEISGNATRRIIEAAQGEQSRLKLAKLGHTNAADAGLDIWSNFGVVISVKNYDLDADLFRSVLADTPIGTLIIVCETVNSDLIVNYSTISKGRRVVFITQHDLMVDLKDIISDREMSNIFQKRFVSFFDSEFPLTATLENFMKERKYVIGEPSDISW